MRHTQLSPLSFVVNQLLALGHLIYETPFGISIAFPTSNDHIKIPHKHFQQVKEQLHLKKEQYPDYAIWAKQN